MTKENFIKRWKPSHMVIVDLDAVIATEIEKAKVQPQPSDKVQISKHTLVEVNRAFRALKQDRNSYIHKVFSDDGVFDAMEEIRKMFDNYFVEQPQEQPAINPIAEAYERGEKVKRKTWEKYEWYKKHTDTHIIDNKGNMFLKPMWDINSMKDKPELWELYTEPAEQPAPKYPIGGYAPGHYTCICSNCKKEFMGDKRAVQCEPCAVKTTSQQPDQVTDQVTDHDQPSSQVKLDNSFDKERFERIFCAIVASGKTETWEQDFKGTIKTIEKLDAFYAEKEKGGSNG